MKQKIGILTMQWANNYGGLLQCYALSTFLRMQGYDCEVVNYWPPYALRKRAAIIGADAVKKEFGDAARKVIGGCTRARIRKTARTKCAHIDAFRYDEIHLSESVLDERQLRLQLETYDSVIVGSDQIWNYKITGRRFEDAYFLNYDLPCRKIAYAASSGSAVPQDLQGRFMQLVHAFDRLSVRENSLAQFLEAGGMQASVVYDPVFLLGRDHWESMASPNAVGEDYILVYTLERNAELVKAANWLSKKIGLPLVVIGKKGLYRGVLKYVPDVPVQEFVSLFLHAKLVVTNSFHGTAFSLIFNKDFFVFPHSTKPARMVDLLKQVGLGERIIVNSRQLVDGKKEIAIGDFSDACEKMETGITASKEYLYRAIESEKPFKKCVSGRLCSGCTACENICPKKAISIQLVDGYYRAVVDEDKCVGCGLCRKICPFNAKVVDTQPQVYAVKHKSDQVRRESSSGGAFSLLAEYVIRAGGVVYGVRFDEKERIAVFDRSKTLEELDAFRQSKYVQAKVGTALPQVAEDLSAGSLVLFTGTPCQIQAVREYVSAQKIDSENLITADIVCHGTPSPEVFKSFVSFLESKHGKQIKAFKFRDKEQGWRGHGYRTVFANGEEILNDYYSSGWSKLFTLSMNDICFQCPFATPSRASDLTMGDYWGIENSNCADMEDKLGVSLVLCNTQRGREILNKLVEDAVVIMTSLEHCKENNPLFRPTFKPAKYDEFQADFARLEFDGFAERYCYYKGLAKAREYMKWLILYKFDMKDMILKHLK